MGSAERSARPSLVDEAEWAVRAWLSPGRYRQGDRLPPEHELAAMLGISRGTLRTALRRLQLTGEIVRRQGSGTFVGRAPSDGVIPGRRRLESYTVRARRPQETLSVTALRIERRAAGRGAAAALSIGHRDRTTVISRVLAVGDAPAAVTEDVFHPAVALPDRPRIRRLLRDGHKIVDVLAAAGVAMSVSRTTIAPTLLRPMDARGRRLMLRADTPCLELEELVHSADGELLLYSRDLYAPWGIELEVLQSVVGPQPAPLPVRAAAPG